MSAENPSDETRRVVSLDICVKALAAAVSALVTSQFGPGLGAVTAVCGLVVSEAVVALVKRLKLKRGPLLAGTGLALFVQADSSFGSVFRKLLGDHAVDVLVHGSTVVAAATTTTAAVGLTAAAVAVPQAAGVDVLDFERGPDGALSKVVAFSPGRAIVLPFEGEESRRALVQLSEFRGVAAVDATIESGGAPLVSKKLTPDDNLIEVRASQPLTAGPHRVVLKAAAGGSAKVDVFVSPDDATATLTPDADGETASLEIETPGQRANVTLEGAEGARAYLELTGPPAVLLFRKEKREGTSAVVTLAAAENVVDIDPERTGTGTVELKAYAVPPDVTETFDLGSSPVDQVFATESPGQRIDLTLTSPQVGRAFVRLSEATVSGVDEPLREVDIGPGQDHHVMVNPEGADVGSVRVEAWLIPEPATGAIEGAPAEITVPGQQAQFPLGTAGPVSVAIQGPATGFSATVYDSTGSEVTTTDQGCVSVEFAGSYSLVVDPAEDGTGQVTATIVDSC